MADQLPQTWPTTTTGALEMIEAVVNRLVASTDPVDVFVSLADALITAGMAAVTIELVDADRLTRIHRPAPDGPRSWSPAQPLAETRELFAGTTAFIAHGSVRAVPIQADAPFCHTHAGSGRQFLGAMVCDLGSEKADEIATAAMALLVRHAVTLINRQRQVDELETEVHNLKRALETNRDIGVAIGILATTTGSSPEESFEAIRRLSQHTNRKLRNVAADVIRTGQLA